MDNEIPSFPYQQNADGTLSPLEGAISVFLTGSTIEICELCDVNEIELSDTNALAFVSKEKLLADIQFRGAISDFHPFKAFIQKADYDPLCFLVNNNDRYGDGNNFEIAWKQSAAGVWKTFIEKQKKRKEEKRNSEDDEELEIPRYKRTRTIRPWISKGSEKEVEEERVDQEQGDVIILARKPLKNSRRSVTLTDVSATKLWSSVDRNPQADEGKKRTMILKVRSYGVMAVKRKENKAIQASGLPYVRDGTQYEPQDLSEDEKNKLFYTPIMHSFLQNAFRKLEEVFMLNNVVDILKEDFSATTEEASHLTEPKETTMKEFQSFTDLVYGKAKAVACIQWSPFEKDVFAMSYMDPSSFEFRSKTYGHPKEFAVLEWKITNAMTPQKILISTSDVTIFRYHPLQPSFIAAGTYAGQILIWDLERKTEKRELAVDRSAQPVKHRYASALEFSHECSVTDLKWLPNKEITKTGALTSLEYDDRQCFVFVTSSIDGRLIFWDMRLEKLLKKGQRMDDAMRLAMKPVFMVSIFGMDSEDINLQRLCFSPTISKQFLAGSLNGDCVLANLIKAENSDHPEIAEKVTSAHAGPITVLERSSFFEDVILSAGGWTFKIWKDNVDDPLFTSSQAQQIYTSGAWSPTRAAVFVLGTSTGTVEVWDVLDRLTQPSLVSNICSVGIGWLDFSLDSKIERGEHGSKSQQFVAVGDRQGTVHLMTMPRSLRKPSRSEHKSMQHLLKSQLLYLQDKTRHQASITRLAPQTEASIDVKEIETDTCGKDQLDYIALEKDLRLKLCLAQE